MTEDEWNRAIANWFFDPKMAGRGVYLSLDDETLAAIAHEIGRDPNQAVEDFESALRLHIAGQSLDPLRPWRARTEEWRRGERSEPPPFIGLLGASVLAASRMGAIKKALGAASYYAPLRAILGLPIVSKMPPGYDSHVPYFWRVLGQWLEDDLKGSSGLPTAWAPPNYWTNIGFSMSQALLRGHDRARLTEFFLAIGATSESVLESNELVARLREWGRGTGRLSERLRGLLDDADLSEQVGRVLASELARWDGTRRDELGRRVLRIVITLDAKRGNLGLATIVPSTFPRAEVEIEGERVIFDPQEGFADLPFEVTRSILASGLSLTFPSFRLQYRDRPIQPLLPDDRMNRWSTCERAEAGRDHFVLANASNELTLVGFLRDRSPGARQAPRIRCPPGWVAYRNVVLTNSSTTVPAVLRPLVPRADVLPGLEGGLRLVSTRSAYLMGGPPDVSVPGVRGETLSVAVDGETVWEVGEEGEVISLVEMALPAGEHQVQVGSLVLRFELLPALRETSHPAVLAHHLARRPSGWFADGPAREIDKSKDVAVSGAALELGSRTDFRWDTAPPFMVKVRSGQRTLAIGPSLEVADLTQTIEQPSWARDLGLPFNSFELERVIGRLPFRPQCIVRLFRQQYQVVPLPSFGAHDVLLSNDCHPAEWGELRAILLSLRHDDEGMSSRQREEWARCLGGEQ